MSDGHPTGTQATGCQKALPGNLILAEEIF